MPAEPTLRDRLAEALAGHELVPRRHECICGAWVHADDIGQHRADAALAVVQAELDRRDADYERMAAAATTAREQQYREFLEIGTELRAERDRLRSAWQSARRRADAYGEGVLRITGERNGYADDLERTEIALEKRGRAVTKLEGQLQDARRAVARVEALHQRYRDVNAVGDNDSCAHCNQISGMVVPWPCPTVVALGNTGTTAAAAEADLARLRAVLAAHAALIPTGLAEALREAEDAADETELLPDPQPVSDAFLEGLKQTTAVESDALHDHYAEPEPPYPFEVWPLHRVLTEVRCGSEDWPWEDEWADLDQRHADTGYLAKLEQQIRDNGITMPILIGNDGRLWDGHHRLRIAVRLGIGYVPVEITPAKLPTGVGASAATPNGTGPGVGTSTGGVRGLLEDVGIDLAGRTVTANGAIVPCRSTQHCVSWGFCHRCAPELAAEASRRYRAASRNVEATQWSELYAGIVKELMGPQAEQPTCGVMNPHQAATCTDDPGRHPDEHHDAFGHDWPRCDDDKPLFSKES